MLDCPGSRDGCDAGAGPPCPTCEARVERSTRGRFRVPSDGLRESPRRKPQLRTARGRTARMAVNVEHSDEVAIVLDVTTVVARLVGGCGGLKARPSSALFSKDPYMGVACHVPNVIACDRVGLGVWLRRPAIAVDATIAGAPLNLNDPQWSGPIRARRRTMFAGFLQPAELTIRRQVIPGSKTPVWLGNDAPHTARTVPHRLRQRSDHRHPNERWLSAGWGKAALQPASCRWPTGALGAASGGVGCDGHVWRA